MQCFPIYQLQSNYIYYSMFMMGEDVFLQDKKYTPQKNDHVPYKRAISKGKAIVFQARFFNGTFVRVFFGGCTRWAPLIVISYKVEL